MGKFIDLTGMTFSKLTVIERDNTDDTYDEPRWVVSCSCGRSGNFSVRGTQLRKKLVNQCKICAHEKVGKYHIKTLTGMVFGSLTVIGINENRRGSKKRVCWWVKCSCGRSEPFSVLGDELKGGGCISCKICGRERIGQIKFKDLTGMVFGKLTVIKQASKKNYGSYWLCECECGNKKFSARAGHLMSGETTSCGCRKESNVASDIKTYYVELFDAKTEYQVIKNPKTNYWLRCDLYFPNKNVYLEINGSQHYEKNPWHERQAKQNNTTSEYEFEYQQYKDNLKREYAQSHGIYIEIDLRTIKTLDQAIQFINQSVPELNIVNTLATQLSN